MTQDERWEEKYNEVMAFMADNHRRPGAERSMAYGRGDRTIGDIRGQGW